jgi:lipid-binding SYLF domain-containing protein
MNTNRLFSSALLSVVLVFASGSLLAADAAQLDRDSHKALKSLYAKIPASKKIGEKAEAILVFPSVTKAGFMIGGQYGEGVLFKRGKAVGYYTTAGASYGLQAGAQTYGYAMFFMNNKALEAITNNEGFEVGVGPSVVVMDEGMAKSATTTTVQDDIYAFIFSQKGLMAGLGIQGNKISKINK